MDDTTFPRSKNLEWLSLATYRDRQCEKIWRLQFNVPENVSAFGQAEQRLMHYRTESSAANRIAEEIDTLARVADGLGIEVKTANGPQDLWCFLFSTPCMTEPVLINGLGEACKWLRERFG